MATTALFVEILVIGALAEVWIGIVILAVAGTLNLRDITAVATALGPLTTLLAVPLLALTYALGWIINFASERLFKPFFQKRIRDHLFRGEDRSYDAARIMVFQTGSSELVHDVLFDRHIIRIARGGVVNFSILAAALLLHLNSGNRNVIFLCSTLSIVVASLSFAQWLTRYRSYYKRIRDTAKVLSSS